MATACCADDSGRTQLTFSEGYIPELIEDQRTRVSLFDLRMADAMIQYDELRQGLRALKEGHGDQQPRHKGKWWRASAVSVWTISGTLLT